MGDDLGACIPLAVKDREYSVFLDPLGADHIVVRYGVDNHGFPLETTLGSESPFYDRIVRLAQTAKALMGAATNA